MEVNTLFIKPYVFKKKVTSSSLRWFIQISLNKHDNIYIYLYYL